MYVSFCFEFTSSSYFPSSDSLIFSVADSATLTFFPLGKISVIPSSFLLITFKFSPRHLFEKLGTSGSVTFFVISLFSFFGLAISSSSFKSLVISLAKTSFTFGKIRFVLVSFLTSSLASSSLERIFSSWIPFVFSDLVFLVVVLWEFDFSITSIFCSPSLSLFSACLLEK